MQLEVLENTISIRNTRISFSETDNTSALTLCPNAESNRLELSLVCNAVVTLVHELVRADNSNHECVMERNASLTDKKCRRARLHAGVIKLLQELDDIA